MLQVAGEVVDVLGADTVDQLRADAPGWDDAECRDCGQPIYLGPLDLHKWGTEVRLDAVDQAMRAGGLIGCTTRPHISG